jgi:cyclopropane-fatty-acyl-phospholipid synthase
MNVSVPTTVAPAPSTASPPPYAARLVLAMLSKLQLGMLSVRLPDGSSRHFGQPSAVLAAADIHIDDWRVFSAVLRGGDIAFAESFMGGQFSTSHLPNLLKLLVANRSTIEQAVYGSWWGNLIDRITHLLRRNSKAQARKNIAAHYDLGNDFYRLWLDSSMTYSAALFDAPPNLPPSSHAAQIASDDGALAAAQRRKYERVLSEIGGITATTLAGESSTAVNSGSQPENAANPAFKLSQEQEHGQEHRQEHRQGLKLLEIGCGWGGFASAAAQAGHSVKGLTLSQAQLNFAQQRMQREGLAQHVNLCLQDYRDENIRASKHASEQPNPASKPSNSPVMAIGGYDGIASIEMFEAVGEQYWPSYFACIARNLKAGGKACVQTIVIRDALFERYRSGTDFIQRYIFPGGMLPSPAKFVALAQAAGLAVVNQHAFGIDYARTLAVWRARFLQQLPAVRAQSYPERFIRMWEFYLAYCEAGFVGGDIDVVQFTLQAPVAGQTI